MCTLVLPNNNNNNKNKNSQILNYSYVTITAGGTHDGSASEQYACFPVNLCIVKCHRAHTEHQNPPGIVLLSFGRMNEPPPGNRWSCIVVKCW